jgi:hypothetical protein
MQPWNLRPAIRKVQDVVATVSDWLAPPATAEQAALVARLRAELNALHQEDSVQLPFWREVGERLRLQAEQSDPMFFMRWPDIAATMVNDTAPFTVAAYRRLRRSPNWTTVWRAAIRHPNFGHAPPFLPDLRTNANTVMHAAHLQRFQEVTGRDLLGCAGIAEFGGGYGSMCRLTAKLGFSGRYTIFDLPPILALQRFFLGLHGLEMPHPNRLLTANLETVAAAMPADTALMSTWAMSEMPIELRLNIEGLFHDSRVSAALLAYQRWFGGIDNTAYFQDLTHRHAAGWNWRRIEIDADSDYLFGVRV